MSGEDREARKKHFHRSAHVLYHIFRYDGLLTPKEAEFATEIPRQTWEKYILGEVACPIEAFASLYQHFPPTRAHLHDVLCPRGHKIVPADEADQSIRQTVEGSICETIRHLSNLERVIIESWEDGKLTEIERQNIREHVVKLSQAVGGIELRAYAGNLANLEAAKAGDIGHVIELGQSKKVRV
ncbi:hypothetical protein JCM15519_07260 [Fundidesulfovibrio butyratiphilus]